jgi:hypothetical protein
MSIVERLVAKLAAQDQRARGGAPLVGATSPPMQTHRSVCSSLVARASSRWSAGECSTQRNGMHTVICGGRNRHCSRNVRRAQSGRPRLGVPPDLRLTAYKPHE